MAPTSKKPQGRPRGRNTIRPAAPPKRASKHVIAPRRSLRLRSQRPKYLDEDDDDLDEDEDVVDELSEDFYPASNETQPEVVADEFTQEDCPEMVDGELRVEELESGLAEENLDMLLDVSQRELESTPSSNNSLIVKDKEQVIDGIPKYDSEKLRLEEENAELRKLLIEARQRRALLNVSLSFSVGRGCMFM